MFRRVIVAATDRRDSCVDDRPCKRPIKSLLSGSQFCMHFINCIACIAMLTCSFYGQLLEQLSVALLSLFFSVIHCYRCTVGK